MVREMQQSDSDRVLEIYQKGLDTKNSTFETVVFHPERLIKE